jgi:choline dehydrogenase
LGAPDLQILFVDVPLTVPSLPGPDQGYALLVSLMAPHSRDSVQLRSAEPQTGAGLDWNYFSDPRDIDALVAGLDLARAIGRAKALDPWRSAEVHPGPEARSGDSLRAYLRRALQTYHHPAGTSASARTTRPCSTPSCAYAELADYARPTPLMMPIHRVRQHTMASIYGVAERAASLMQE